jgi:hypothetical protein
MHDVKQRDTDSDSELCPLVDCSTTTDQPSVTPTLVTFHIAL